MRAALTPSVAKTAPPPARDGGGDSEEPHCFGFSFTIMYLVLPQFGTGSV